MELFEFFINADFCLSVIYVLFFIGVYYEAPLITVVFIGSSSWALSPLKRDCISFIAR